MLIATHSQTPYLRPRKAHKCATRLLREALQHRPEIANVRIVRLHAAVLGVPLQQFNVNVRFSANHELELLPREER